MVNLIILVMSCNQEFFHKQNDLIRNTWGKTAKELGINVIFYEGNPEKTGNDQWSYTEDMLYLNCGDGLEDTYAKTYFALDAIKDLYHDAFVFRTNTSTYVNVQLLKHIVNTNISLMKYIGTELYSLSEANAPYPLCAYMRGNGILFTPYTINLFIRYGKMFLFENKVDDTYIGNVLNTCLPANGVPDSYKTYLHVLPHAWYKCVPMDFSVGHKLCNYGTAGDFDFYKNFVTIQIKCYRNREQEEKHYKEVHAMFRLMSQKELEDATLKASEYAENPSVFIGSTLGYIDFDTWEKMDKNKLYKLEVSNKASDDPEHIKHYSEQNNPIPLELAQQAVDRYMKY